MAFLDRQVGALSEIQIGTDGREGRPQLVGRVAEEALQGEVVLLEGREHFVERDCELADLVSAPSALDARREVAGQGNRAGRPGDVGDWTERTPSEDETDGQRQPDNQDATGQ